MGDSVSLQNMPTTLPQQLQFQANLHQLQGQQHEQGAEQLLLGKLGAGSLVQCQQALHTLQLNGFQALLQPAEHQLSGNSQAAFLQAELPGVTRDAGGALAAYEVLQSQPAAVAAVAADAVATIVAPRRRAAKQQPAAVKGAAASSKQTCQSRKRKAAAATAGGTSGTAEATETAQEAAAASKADNNYNSQLLAFGQQLADQVLAHLQSFEAEPSAEPSSCIEVPRMMQLLQPIVDKMLQDNPAALGEPITADHKAFFADLRRRGGGSAGEGAADRLLRYEQFEQLIGQMDVGAASMHLGIGKTRMKEICRSFGVIRWPYRDFCCIYGAQEFLDDKSSNDKAKDAAALPARRLLLIHALHLLQQHPNMVFKGHPASVLTQVFHKQTYKKKKTQARHADQTAAQVLTDISTAGTSCGSSMDGSGSATEDGVKHVTICSNAQPCDEQLHKLQ